MQKVAPSVSLKAKFGQLCCRSHSCCSHKCVVRVTPRRGSVRGGIAGVRQLCAGAAAAIGRHLGTGRALLPLHGHQQPAAAGRSGDRDRRRRRHRVAAVAAVAQPNAAPAVISAEGPAEDIGMRRSLLLVALIVAAPIIGVSWFGSSAGAQQTPSGKAGTKERSAQAPSSPDHVFVNGALAVPGAPASDTVPAKFSEKNAADDRLITTAYTFKQLSADQRRAIYQALKDQK